MRSDTRRPNKLEGPVIMPANKEDLTPSEAAEICGVGYRLILRAAASGDLACMRYNERVIRFTRAALIEWRMNVQARTAANKPAKRTNRHKSSQSST